MEAGEVALIAIPPTMAVLGFLAGMSGTRYPKVPWIATAVMVLAYICLLAFLGSWASRCPGCYPSAETTRAQWVGIAAYAGIFATLALIAIVWLGALASVGIRGALHWVRWMRAPDEDARAKLEAGR